MQSNVRDRGDTSSLKVTNSVVDDDMSIGFAVSERLILMRRTRLKGHDVSYVTTWSFYFSSLIFGFPFLKLMLGGIRPVSRTRIALITAAIPAAASRWPIYMRLVVNCG